MLVLAVQFCMAIFRFEFISPIIMFILYKLSRISDRLCKMGCVCHIWGLLCNMNLDMILHTAMFGGLLETPENILGRSVIGLRI